jgi:hypothetical protein
MYCDRATDSDNSCFHHTLRQRSYPKNKSSKGRENSAGKQHLQDESQQHSSFHFRCISFISFLCRRDQTDCGLHLIGSNAEILPWIGLSLPSSVHDSTISLSSWNHSVFRIPAHVLWQDSHVARRSSHRICILSSLSISTLFALLWFTFFWYRIPEYVCLFSLKDMKG